MKTQPTRNRDQLTFDWSAKAAAPSVDTCLFDPRKVEPIPSPDERHVEAAEREEFVGDWKTPILADEKKAGLIRILPWDFRTSFPEPERNNLLPVLDGAGDDRKAVLKEHHAIHTQRGLALLSEIDWIIEAQRLGFDPNTGLPLADAQSRDEAVKRLERERVEQEAVFERLINDYASRFGKTNAEFFRTAIRVWHLGGTVITPSPPTSPALEAAVMGAHFGHEEDGTPVNPSEEEVLAVTEELAEHLRDVDDCDLRQSLLHQYRTDFGAEPAAALDHWSQSINRAEEDDTASLQYDPGHPWYYYHEGDAAEPLPVDDIPSAPSCDLPSGPKNPKKRIAFLQQILVDQEDQLTRDRERYTALVDQGVEALSEYDRNIAHAGNDDLAWASAMALKFNHIRYGQARVAAIHAALVKARLG
jgi:hypothetical protein